MDRYLFRWTISYQGYHLHNSQYFGTELFLLDIICYPNLVLNSVIIIKAKVLLSLSHRKP